MGHAAEVQAVVVAVAVAVAVKVAVAVAVAVHQENVTAAHLEFLLMEHRVLCMFHVHAYLRYCVGKEQMVMLPHGLHQRVYLLQ